MRLEMGIVDCLPRDKSGSLRSGCKKRVKHQGLGDKPWEPVPGQPELEPREVGRGAGMLMEPRGPWVRLSIV